MQYQQFIEEISLKLDNGQIYRGEISAQKIRQGFGLLQDKNGKDVYCGYWRENKYSGRGLHMNIDPQIIMDQRLSWKNMANLGRGWAYYEGQFENGLMHGKGNLILTNKELYSGNFKNNLLDGEGSFTNLDNKVIFAIWENGIFKKESIKVIKVPQIGKTLTQSEAQQQLNSEMLDDKQKQMDNLKKKYDSDLIDYQTDKDRSQIKFKQYEQQIREVNSKLFETIVTIDQNTLSFAQKELLIEQLQKQIVELHEKNRIHILTYETNRIQCDDKTMLLEQNNAKIQQELVNTQVQLEQTTEALKEARNNEIIQKLKCQSLEDNLRELQQTYILQFQNQKNNHQEQQEQQQQQTQEILQINYKQLEGLQQKISDLQDENQTNLDKIEAIDYSYGQEILLLEQQNVQYQKQIDDQIDSHNKILNEQSILLKQAQEQLIQNKNLQSQTEKQFQDQINQANSIIETLKQDYEQKQMNDQNKLQQQIDSDNKIQNEQSTLLKQAQEQLIQMNNHLIQIEKQFQEQINQANSTVKALTQDFDQKQVNDQNDIKSLKERIVQVQIQKEGSSIRHREEKLCQICLDKNKSYMAVPCGHLYCEDCIIGVVQKKECYTCRQENTQQVRMYD